ncbi:MAG: hypothetical protein K0B14_18605, partial [Anaerolineaceae bacterium]|nr:hypothetical protein [Anaerolineaceae bacterium]
ISGFRTKCYNRIDKLLKNSAVVFVTHSMPHVARMCKLSLCLEKGVSSGLLCVQEGIFNYNNSVQNKRVDTKRLGSKEATFVSIIVNKEKIEITQKSTVHIDYGDNLDFEISVISNKSCYITLDLTFHTRDGEAVAECNNYISEEKIYILDNHRNFIKVSIKKFSLNPGFYNLSILLMSENMTAHYDWLQNFCELFVKGKPAFAGQQFLADWELTHDEA